MRSFETDSRNTRNLRRVTAGLLLLAACSTQKADTSSLSDSDASFIDEVRAVYVYPTKAGSIPTIQRELKVKYEKYKTVDQRDFWGDSQDNVLTFKPNRYKLSFKKGDGSGTDTACEKLRVPEGTKYVAATTDSSETAWIFLNETGDLAHICFDPGNNPETVLAWASAEDR